MSYGWGVLGLGSGCVLGLGSGGGLGLGCVPKNVSHTLYLSPAENRSALVSKDSPLLSSKTVRDSQRKTNRRLLFFFIRFHSRSLAVLENRQFSPVSTCKRGPRFF